MKHLKDPKRFWLAVAILALCGPVFSADQIVASQWAAAPVRIDGVNNDWASQGLNLEKKTSVEYAFMNDAQNLYVLVVFKEPKFLSSINLTGLTIWFGPENQKKKDYGLRFVNRTITADQYIAMLEKKTGTVAEAQKAQIRANPRYMFYDYELINKTVKEGPAQFAETPDPIVPVFRNASQEKTIVYEVSIPLRRLAELSAALGAEPGKTIEVGFEWGGATKGMKEAVASQIGSEGARSKTEGATGTLTAERGGGGGLGDLESQSEALVAMRRRIPKQYSFWVGVKLAQNQ